jgi:AraC family cel operon transcriptional repressor
MADAAYHIARVSCPTQRKPPGHDHNFAEVFWVESGEGQHLVNGTSVPLATGDVIFMRAEDIHLPYASKGHTLVIVNLAFRLDTLAFLRERYFPQETGFFWSPNRLPECLTLRGDQHLQLGDTTRELAQTARTRLHLERFLLNLLCDLSAPLPAFNAPQPPPWIRELCLRLHDPEVMARGVPALVDAAGRSAEHVAREVKRWTGKTPTQLLNDARLNIAATMLCMSDARILDIALDAGFANLAHFYTLFRAQFGETPRQYRVRHRSVY